MEDISILFPDEIYCLIDDELVELPPIVLKKYFKLMTQISGFMSNLSEKRANPVVTIIETIDISTKFLKSIVKTVLPDLSKEKFRNITLPQMTQILIMAWIDVLGSIKTLEDKPKDVNKSIDNKSENNFVIAIDLMLSEYHWEKDYIWNNITMIQFMTLINAIAKRKEADMKLMGALHGVDMGKSGRPSDEEKKAMQNTYGKQSKVKDSDLQGVMKGNISGLKRIGLWIGIAIPSNIDIDSNEENLRILISSRLKDLEKIKKLPKIDMSLDPIATCYKIEQDDIIGIKEKLEELNLVVPNIEAIKADPDRFKAVLMSKYISNLNG